MACYIAKGRSIYLSILGEIAKGKLSYLDEIKEVDPDFHWFTVHYPKSRETCLHLAARYGNTDVIRHLLDEFRPKITEIRSSDHKTPLHEAAQAGHYDAVKVLVEYGADVNAIKRSDWTPMMLACTKTDGAYPDIVEFLLNNGALPNVKNKDGWSCLHIASRNPDTSILKVLLNHETVDLTSRTKNGRSALHVAALHGNVAHFKLLASTSQIHPNSADSSGNTIFHEAVMGGNIELIDYLLTEMAVDSKVKNKNGANAIHLAAVQSLCNVIEHLVCKYKFNLNKRDSNGYTALHYAVRNGNDQVADCLVRLGARSDIKDKTGKVVGDYRHRS